MYGTDRMKDYTKVVSIEPGWDKVLEKYNITWIIYDTDYPLCQYLMERKDWKLIYSDKVASIFVKNNQENKNLIERYPNVKLMLNKDKD